MQRSDAVTEALLASVPPFGTPPFGTGGAGARHGAGHPQQHRAAVGAAPQWAHRLAPVAPRNGFGVAALCLALVGLPFALIPLTGIVAALLGALAVVFGLLGCSRARRGVATNRTMSAIGTALGLITLGVGVAGVVILVRATGAFVGDLEDLGVRLPAAAPAADISTAPGYTFRLSGSAPGATVMWSVDGSSGGDQAGRLPWDRTIGGAQDGSGSSTLTAYTNPGSGGDLTCTITGSDGRVLDTRTARPTGGAAGSAAVTCSALG
ncbi:hypothetical protein I4I78_32130 [Pseudonocardia sp. KRD-291]|nr:hypothetical protein [Pseudonocardia sp. KRD291]